MCVYVYTHKQQDGDGFEGFRFRLMVQGSLEATGNRKSFSRARKLCIVMQLPSLQNASRDREGVHSALHDLGDLAHIIFFSPARAPAWVQSRSEHAQHKLAVKLMKLGPQLVSRPPFVQRLLSKGRICLHVNTARP